MRDMALRNGRFGQLRGGFIRRGGTHGHRMPIPALWGWVGAAQISAPRCGRPQQATWRWEMAVFGNWEGEPVDEVARTATECRFQPSAGGWARPRLARRAAGALDARHGVEKWPFRATESGGQSMRWHARPPNADFSHRGVGGRAPD